MDTKLSLEPPWTGARWRRSVLVVLLAQIWFLIFFTGEKQAPIPHRSSSEKIAILAMPEDQEQLHAALQVEDPTLFAQPQQHNFSGAAWLNQKAFPYSIPGWAEPPRLLAMPTWELARDMSLYLQARPGNSLSLFEQPASILAPSRQSALDQPSGSYLSIEGALSHRLLSRPPQLSSQSFTDVLNNTVVEIAVFPDGSVFTTRLLSGSGSKKADMEALQQAKNLRFEPKTPGLIVPGGNTELTWGKAIFHWFTTEWTETNQPPSKL